MTFDQVLQIAAIIVGLGVVAVGAALKMAIGRMTDRLERLEMRTRENERNVARLREKEEKDIARVYDKTVLREDWIRETSRMRETLERVVEGQARLEGRLDVARGIAAAVERLVEDKVRKANDGGG